jgi:hypothetical protein
MIKEYAILTVLVSIWVSLAVLTIKNDHPRSNYGENNCINLDEIELQSYRIQEKMEAIDPNWKNKN